MTTPSLRERKKRRTREEIARAAAELFAERGYENVSVLDVARAAEVSEQTVYNYFSTKRELVLDRDAQLRSRLVELVRDRPAGTSPAEAIRAEAIAFASSVRELDDADVRGGLGYLAARSPEVRRLSLEMTDRHADAIAAVLAAEPGGPSAPVAKLRATALAWVFQSITDEAGRAAAAGRPAPETADDLVEVVEALLAELVG